MVDSFSLYSRLWDVATAMSAGGKGFPRGTEIAFPHASIVAVLQSMGIREERVERAIQYCLRNGLLEERDDGFHLVQSELSSFRMTMRRI